MDKNAIWKWLILSALVIFSLVMVIPPNGPNGKIRKGLDLAGGTSFTVQIDEQALRSETMAAEPSWNAAQVDSHIADVMRDADSRTVEVLRNRVDKIGVNEPIIVPGKDHRILIQLPGADTNQQKAAEQSIRSAAFLQFRLVHKDNARLSEALLDSGKAPEGYTVVLSGSRKFLERVGKTAYDTLLADPEYGRRLATFAQPDPNHVLMLQPERQSDGRTLYSPCFVRIKSEMTGKTLKRAEVERDAMSGTVNVSLTFKPEGAIEFAKITSYYAPNGLRNKDSTGRQLAIVLDSTLYSAPVIREPIPNGRASISGDFSLPEAALLRNILNAGSLPAPVKILEKHVIDASLGKGAIASGVRAAVIAGVVVAIFMLIYYMYCGLIANLALLANLILLPAGMILVSGVFSVFASDAGGSKGPLQLPVLTMPGIAGIVLTIGMAVDANVLIFERIREEFAAGKSARAAIAAGYHRAFSAILDSNLTTLLTGVLLFIFGSGPIRGFAITLSAGIIVSMYTAITLTRMIFNATVPATRTQPYRMLQAIRATSIDFLAKRQIAITFSLAVIVLTIGIFVFRVIQTPRRVLAVDFTGGSVLSYNFDAAQPVDALQAALKAAGVDDALVQTQSDLQGSSAVIQIKTGKELVDGAPIAEAATAALQKAFPAAGFRLAGEELIGSQIGQDLSRDAFWAMLLAMVGMIIYITVRFEFGFALGAIVALLHDVLVTLGVFTLLDRQVSLTVVACLMTIVGYSVNDTIVIFDRIREDLKLDQRGSFRDICNLSINQTLSRTLLTSLTVMMATIVLFIFGGGAINDFALCMLIGLVAGTYSTVFIATPVTLMWYGGRRPGFVAGTAARK